MLTTDWQPQDVIEHSASRAHASTFLPSSLWVLFLATIFSSAFSKSENWELAKDILEAQ